MSIQPTPDADATARQAKLAARIAVRRRFNELLFQASQLLQKADEVAALGGLSDIEIQQARAAGKIAGVNLYAIAFVADDADFRRLDTDLRHIAYAVDPLILAIGEDAKANSNAISMRGPARPLQGRDLQRHRRQCAVLHRRGARGRNANLPTTLPTRRLTALTRTCKRRSERHDHSQSPPKSRRSASPT